MKKNIIAIILVLAIIASFIAVVVLANDNPENSNLLFIPIGLGVVFIIYMAGKDKRRRQRNTYNSTVNYALNFLKIQINTQYNILQDCMNILKNSTQLPTLIGRYDLAMDTANKLLEIERENMTDEPFFYHNECIRILTESEALKNSMINHFMEVELYQAELLKTVKGKTNRYMAMKSMLLEQQAFFDESEAYKSALKTIDKRLNIQESVSKFPKASETTDASTGHSTKRTEKAGSKEEISNSQIPHTATDQYELDEFLANDFTDTLKKKCRVFKELYSKSRAASSTEEEIMYLQKCIDAYENAKECFYAYSEGAKIYFQDNYENLRNSNGESCGWSDAVYKRLGDLQFRINCLYPWIKETAITGFAQTDIYQVFPDRNRSELYKAIDALVSDGIIKKTKQGNTYMITLAEG